MALPSVSYRLADGTTIPLWACARPSADPAQPAITRALTRTGWPDQVPAVIPFPPAKDPAVWQATTSPNLDQTVAATSPAGDPLPATGIGLLTAPANAYLNTRISRQYGQVFVMHAQAPTSPDTRAGQWVGTRSQVRYWSVCINSTLGATQTVACLFDHQLRLNPDGTYTIAVSTVADRPTNAPNWLPLGDVYDGWIYMRQFLAAPWYTQSISSVGAGESPATVMGPYFPVSGYCSTATFEHQGAGACLR